VSQEMSVQIHEIRSERVVVLFNTLPKSDTIGQDVGENDSEQDCDECDFVFHNENSIFVFYRKSR
jgi:hypothetical protein